MTDTRKIESTLEARGHIGKYENATHLCKCTKDVVQTRTGSNTRSSGTSNTSTPTRVSTTSTSQTKSFDPAAHAAQLTRSRNLSTAVLYSKSTTVDTTKMMVLEYRSGYAFYVPRPKQSPSPTISDSVKDQLQNSDIVDGNVVPTTQQPVLDQQDINDINDTSNMANNANGNSQQSPSNGTTDNSSGNNNGSGQQNNGGQQTWYPSNGNNGGSGSNSASNGQQNGNGTDGNAQAQPGANTGTNDLPKNKINKAGGWVLGIAVGSLLLGRIFFGNKDKNKEQ